MDANVADDEPSLQLDQQHQRSRSSWLMPSRARRRTDDKASPATSNSSTHTEESVLSPGRWHRQKLRVSVSSARLVDDDDSINQHRTQSDVGDETDGSSTTHGGGSGSERRGRSAGSADRKEMTRKPRSRRRRMRPLRSWHGSNTSSPSAGSGWPSDLSNDETGGDTDAQLESIGSSPLLAARRVASAKKSTGGVVNRFWDRDGGRVTPPPRTRSTPPRSMAASTADGMQHENTLSLLEEEMLNSSEASLDSLVQEMSECDDGTKSIDAATAGSSKHEGKLVCEESRGNERGEGESLGSSGGSRGWRGLLFTPLATASSLIYGALGVGGSMVGHGPVVESQSGTGVDNKGSSVNAGSENDDATANNESALNIEPLYSDEVGTTQESNSKDRRRRISDKFNMVLNTITSKNEQAKLLLSEEEEEEEEEEEDVDVWNGEAEPLGGDVINSTLVETKHITPLSPQHIQSNTPDIPRKILTPQSKAKLTSTQPKSKLPTAQTNADSTSSAQHKTQHRGKAKAPDTSNTDTTKSASPFRSPRSSVAPPQTFTNTNNSPPDLPPLPPPPPPPTQQQHSSSLLSRGRVGSLKQSVSRMQGRLLSLLGASSESARRQWVCHVTNRHATPPSAKYMGKLVMLSWETQGESIHEFYRFLRARPVLADPICALKALVCSLRLLQHGPVQVVDASFKHVLVVDAIGAAWAQRLVGDHIYKLASSEHARDIGELRLLLLIARLSAIIMQKQHFHHTYQQFDSRFRQRQDDLKFQDFLEEQEGEKRGGDGGAFRTTGVDDAEHINEVDGAVKYSDHVDVGVNVGEIKKKRKKKKNKKKNEDVNQRGNMDDDIERDVQMASRMLTLLGAIDGVVRLALGINDVPNSSTSTSAASTSTPATTNAVTSPPVIGASDSIGARASAGSAISNTSASSVRNTAAESENPESTVTSSPNNTNTKEEEDDEDEDISKERYVRWADGGSEEHENRNANGNVGDASVFHSTRPISPTNEVPGFGAVLPLIEESYNIYLALSALLIDLSYSVQGEHIDGVSGGAGGGGDDQNLVSSLIAQYTLMYEAMQDYFQAATVSPALRPYAKEMPNLPAQSALVTGLQQFATPAPTVVTSSASLVISPSGVSNNNNSNTNNKNSNNNNIISMTVSDVALASESMSNKSETLNNDDAETKMAKNETATSTWNSIESIGSTNDKHHHNNGGEPVYTAVNTGEDDIVCPTDIQVLALSPTQKQHKKQKQQVHTQPEQRRSWFSFSRSVGRDISTGSELDTDTDDDGDDDDEQRTDTPDRSSQDDQKGSTAAAAALSVVTSEFVFNPFASSDGNTKNHSPNNSDWGMVPAEEYNPFESLTNPFASGFASIPDIRSQDGGQSTSGDVLAMCGGGNGGIVKSLAQATAHQQLQQLHSHQQDSTSPAGEHARREIDALRPNATPKIAHVREEGGQGGGRDRGAIERAVEQCVKSFELSGVVISFEELALGKTIGRGAFAIVYQAMYMGKEVAVKELQLRDWGQSANAIHDFRAELTLMKAMHHPNILDLIGACTRPTLCLVSEFCHRGNLLDLLHTDRLRTDHAAASASAGNTDVVTTSLPWSLRLRLGLDEARGVHFLHTGFPAPLIHRDLKSPNLLITQNWTLKVSDFGLSRFRHSSFESLLTGQVGTFQWMAPEVVMNRSYNESADVYSFGVNLWELATRQIPYRGLAPVQVAVAVTARGERPPMDPQTLDEGCPPELCALIEKCWSQEPADRPVFEEIIWELKRIAKHVEEEGV